MYWISIETEFEASHQLTFSDGTQEVLHPHPWQVTAAVCAEALNRDGLVMDFLLLEEIVNTAIALSGKTARKDPLFPAATPQPKMWPNACSMRSPPHYPLPVWALSSHRGAVAVPDTSRESKYL